MMSNVHHDAMLDGDANTPSGKRWPSQEYSEQRKQQKYWACLREFMALTHQREGAYERTHEFTEEELAAVTPTDVVRYINFKVFDNLEPTSYDPRPTSGTHHTVAYYKK
jgi:hypothetical protein